MSNTTINPPPSASTRPIIVWDTETTGLGPTKNAIIEIGLMELPITASTSSTRTFSSLIHAPNTTMHKAVTSIHGITNSMIQAAPPFMHVWANVVEYVSQICSLRPGRPILVAHNLQFDLSFLREELARVGLQMPEWDFVCSLNDVARVLWPGKKASLAALGERFNIVNERAHRALGDVKVTAKILEYADRELREVAKKMGTKLKADGGYIRDIIETAAQNRRGCVPQEQTVLMGKKRTVTMVQGADGEAAILISQFYVTPHGLLWHSDRACKGLDEANVIRKMLIRPHEKLACIMCVKQKGGADIVQEKRKNKGKMAGVKDRIVKKNAPEKNSSALKATVVKEVKDVPKSS